MLIEDYNGQTPNANFTPLSECEVALGRFDRVIQLGRTNFPTIDAIKPGMAIMVGDEIMSLQAVDLPPGTITVFRGCADTIPALHEAKTLMWFFDATNTGSDGVEHVAGEDNTVKYSTFTIGGGSFNPEESDYDQLTYNWRFYRPYPPGQLRVDGERWYIPAVVGADDPVLSLTWVHRDRVLQSDQLVDHDSATIGPEAGTNYTLRVYNTDGILRRTIVISNQANYFDYTWDMAMFDMQAMKQDGALYLPGKITVYSTRDGFDSWQGYEIPFEVNVQGYFLKVAQLSQQAGQVYMAPPVVPGEEPPPDHAVFAGQIAQVTGQSYMEGDDGAPPSAPAGGMYIAQVAEGAAQATSFYTPLTRNLFEAPYASLAKRGVYATGANLITVAARPSDKLTDTHIIYTRYDRPKGSGSMFPYTPKIEPTFTPWITLGNSIGYLDTIVVIGKSSFYDGVSLQNVLVGQVAMIDSEIVRVDAKDATTITIARGCYDTIPQRHYTGNWMWFFDTAAGFDPTVYPNVAVDGKLGAGIQVKMVPSVYGTPLDIAQVPADRLDTFLRVERPYPPGNVFVAGQHWYKGRVVNLGDDTLLTWNHRSREVQGGQAVDHTDLRSPTPEDNQKYRLSITIIVPGINGHPPTKVVVREEFIQGEEFLYTYDMAQIDGYRAGQMLKACGRVTVGMILETFRDPHYSWQYYVIPFSLPSYICPPNQPPGGGQLPPPGGGGSGGEGGGSGEIGGGGYTPPPVSPPSSGGSGGPGDNTGDGPGTNDGGGAGDNGGGVLPPPPVLPPDWPDPIDPPPPGPDPQDPNPDLAAHWDTNWDRHWDAYNDDNQGG